MPAREGASVLAIVQARLSSTRLPNKVLSDSGMGEPLLELLLRRLDRSRLVDEICVATSIRDEDSNIAQTVTALGYRVHRGPLDDTLTRFAQAADGFAGAIVRITGDCPLIDPEIVDRVITAYRENDCAYASNIDPPTFPDGLDCEVFASDVLNRIACEQLTASDREHVTPAIRRDPARFPRCNVTNSPDLSQLRITVDSAEDLEQVRRIVRTLGARRFVAPMGEILTAGGFEVRI